MYRPLSRLGLGLVLVALALQALVGERVLGLRRRDEKRVSRPAGVPTRPALRCPSRRLGRGCLVLYQTPGQSTSLARARPVTYRSLSPTRGRRFLQLLGARQLSGD